ncbi:MAG: MBL fold metallo-hydrolase [Nitriliruptorales bacterium]|nr:MBL fold metallo-hydrolase [Nitriliruptorales bacterium]
MDRSLEPLMDNRTEQLADGVWRVEVTTYVNAYVLANDGCGDAEGLTLVDTGTPRSGPRLVRSIRLMGLDPRAVGDVLLTHWHADHAGSAARFARSSAAPTVWVGEGDLAVVREGLRPPVPPRRDTTALGRPLSRLVPPPPGVPAVSGLADGARLEAAGGIQVVASPGHTPGHLAYLVASRGVLLTGDALLNVLFLSRGPRLLRSARSIEQDTIKRLAGLEFDLLAFGHGPPLLKRARERLAALARVSR